MEKPQECHLTTVKGVLRYIKGTINQWRVDAKEKDISTDAEVHGYTNSDFSGDQEEECCKLHIHDWRCPNLLGLKKAKHYGFVIL